MAAESRSRTRILAVVSLAAVVGCQDPQQCTLWWGTPGAGSAIWRDCGDKKERRLECDMEEYARVARPGSLPPLKCACIVDGITGKRFETADPMTLETRPSATRLANAECGWRVTR